MPRVRRGYDGQAPRLALRILRWRLPDEDRDFAIGDLEEEFLADCFAGFLLMPKAAVVRGFASRGWVPTTATPEQVFTVAGWLGVGYDALITHMHANLRLLNQRQAASLRKVTPKKIKSQLLGRDWAKELLIADPQWEGRALDIQVGDAILVPSTVVLEHAGLVRRRRSGRHQVCVLRERPLIEAGRWIEAQTAFWSGSLDSLAGYLSEEQ